MSEIPPTYPQQQGQPYGQQGPPGYYQGGPPPKTKHTLRNVLIVLGVLMVLVVGGCIALIGGAANEIDKKIKEEEANDTPTEVNVGKAFSHDDYSAAAGWKVTKDGIGGVTIKGLRVTNDSDERRNALFSFKFYRGTENLAEVECSSNELQGGESSKMECVSFSADYPTGFKTIKVADSF